MTYEATSSMCCNVCVLRQKNLLRIEDRIRQSFIDLRTCRGCKLVKYCDKEHQFADWPMHSEFCHAMQKILNTYGIGFPFELGNADGIIRSREAFENTIIRLKYLATTIMRRPLTHMEEDLLSFPAVCGYCFDYKLPVMICAKCESQAYCCLNHLKKHEAVHKEICHWLQLYYTPFKAVTYVNTYNLQAVDKVADFRKVDLIEAFEIVYRTKLSLNPIRNRWDHQMFAYAADFSCITTICYALSYTNMEAVSSTKFVIFIVGATVEGHLWFQEAHAKFFFHHYPKITALELHLIGPELQSPYPSCLRFKYLGQKRLVIYICYNGLYQDYIKFQKIIPSMVVMFNCGFSDYSRYKTTTDVKLIPIKSENEIEAKDDKKDEQINDTNDDKKDEQKDEQKNEQKDEEKDEQKDELKNITKDKQKAIKNDIEKEEKKIFKDPNVFPTSAGNPWSEALPNILQFYDLPIIFTSFTKQEANYDYAALLMAAKNENINIKVERIFKLEKNPYHDLRPLRQWYPDDDEKIFFRNAYVQGIRTYIVNGN